MDDDELAISVQSENKCTVALLLPTLLYKQESDCHMYDHQVQYISSSLVRTCRIL